VVVVCVWGGGRGGGGTEYYPIVLDAKTANDADYSSLHPIENAWKMDIK
jgi:hypothetical protein